MKSVRKSPVVEHCWLTDIDLNINDASVLGEVEFVCFNCICLSSVPNWTKRIRIPEEKFFQQK